MGQTRDRKTGHRSYKFSYFKPFFKINILLLQPDTIVQQLLEFCCHSLRVVLLSLVSMIMMLKERELMRQDSKVR